jgi:chaperonin cofactor prefoldin
MLTKNELLKEKIEELEKKYEKHDKQFKIIFEALREFLETPNLPNKKPIGFHANYD